MRTGTADAVDVGEGDHHALIARDVDTGKTCHVGSLFPPGFPAEYVEGVEQNRCPGLRPEVSPAPGIRMRVLTLPVCIEL